MLKSNEDIKIYRYGTAPSIGTMNCVIFYDKTKQVNVLVISNNNISSSNWFAGDQILTSLGTDNFKLTFKQISNSLAALQQSDITNIDIIIITDSANTANNFRSLTTNEQLIIKNAYLSGKYIIVVNDDYASYSGYMANQVINMVDKPWNITYDTSFNGSVSTQVYLPNYSSYPCLFNPYQVIFQVGASSITPGRYTVSGSAVSLYTHTGNILVAHQDERINKKGIITCISGGGLGNLGLPCVFRNYVQMKRLEKGL